MRHHFIWSGLAAACFLAASAQAQDLREVIGAAQARDAALQSADRKSVV